MKTVIDVTKERNETITITCAISDIAGLGEVLHQFERAVPDTDMSTFETRLRSHVRWVNDTIVMKWFSYSKQAVFDDCHEG